MLTSPVCFVTATGCIVGTYYHILQLLRSHCTKDYVNNDEDNDDNVDVDNAVDVDKDVGYGVRTSWSPRRWVLAVKDERMCAPMLYIPIHAEDCVAEINARIIILGPDLASFGITSWPCPVCLES